MVSAVSITLYHQKNNNNFKYSYLTWIGNFATAFGDRLRKFILQSYFTIFPSLNSINSEQYAAIFLSCVTTNTDVSGE